MLVHVMFLLVVSGELHKGKENLRFVHTSLVEVDGNCCYHQHFR